MPTESVASVREESCRLSAADFIEQPGPREPDVAMHRRRRCTYRFGDLVVGQSTKIMQLDHLGQSRLHLLQALEGVIERDDVEVGRRQRLAHVFGDKLSRTGIALYSGA